MKKQLSRHSLKYRIAAIIFVLELIMMGAVLSVTLSHSLETSQQHLTDSENVLLDLLGDLSRIALITAEYDELQPYIEQITSVPHVTGVFLTNRDDRIVVSSDVKYIGEKLAVPENTDTSIWKQKDIANATGKIGTLAINFSHKDLVEANQDSLNLGIKIALTGMFVIALVGVAIGFLLTRRLESLASSAQRIAKGDLEVRTNLRGNDEVAIVGKAFDYMAENIKTYINTLVDSEEELRRAHAELEKRVEERTRQLAIARDEAIRANRSKSTFLANMSHEIRTPLTSIIGFSESLLDKSLAEQEKSQSINAIIDSGKHLLKIINDILDLSKIEAEKLDVEQIEISPYTVINDIKSIISLQAKNKDLYFNIEYNFPLPEKIISDPVRIKQILLNICGNAVKFTFKGGVTLNVSCDYDKQVMIFNIIDTGIGLDETQKERIFNAFEQADSTTTRQYGGTGLGLKLSTSLAEMLGGSISVTSTPQAGSCFTVTIATGKINKSELIYELSDFEQTTPEFHKPDNGYLSGNVLLVEDNHDNQKLISLHLRRAGADVEIADNGQEAVNMARDRQYDLILMDMQMPIMSGLEATKLLRTINYTKPIAALTANAMQEDINRYYAGGCDTVLSKPIVLKEFYAVLEKYLRRIEQRHPEPAVFSSLIKEDDSFIEIVSDFIANLPDTLANIDETYTNSDWENLRFEIHTLKGTGGNFGFDDITRLCREIEIKIDNRNYDSIRPLLEELNSLYQRIQIGIKYA